MTTHRHPDDDRLFPTYQLAQLLEVDRQNIYRWRRNGLHWLIADRLAGLIGMPTVAVWPSFYDDEPYISTKRHEFVLESLCK